MYGIIQLLTDPEFYAVILTAAAVFATILTFTLPLLQGDKLNARLKSVASRREELRLKSREALIDAQGKKSIRKDSKGLLDDLADMINLEQLMDAPGTRKTLAMAGLRGQGPYLTYMFIRLLGPFVLAAIGALYAFVLVRAEMAPVMKFAIPVAAFAAGYYLPTVILRNIIERRQQSIQRAFPDALDLLLICVESGMSIEAAFSRVAAEVGTQSPELAEEMGLTTAELSFLQDRSQAYENLAIRTDLPGVKAVTTSLIQAERYGTPVGTALRVMAEENRSMRMQAAEKKAAALPAQLTVPMIVFFLPVLFMVILGPAAIRFFDTQ
jgi:tight adherence protein C